MNSLYDIKTRLIELIQNDELNEEERKELASILVQELTNKSTSIIGFVRNVEVNMEALDNEINRLVQIKKKNTLKMEKFKEYVKSNMEAMGVEKIETPIGILRVQKNPISVEIVSEEEVPEDYKKVKTTVTIDKNAIKDNFKETGEIIPGTRMITNKTTLRII